MIGKRIAYSSSNDVNPVNAPLAMSVILFCCSLLARKNCYSQLGTASVMSPFGPMLLHF